MESFSVVLDLLIQWQGGDPVMVIADGDYQDDFVRGWWRRSSKAIPWGSGVRIGAGFTQAALLVGSIKIYYCILLTSIRNKCC
jgi:hypothetical protein